MIFRQKAGLSFLQKFIYLRQPPFLSNCLNFLINFLLLRLTSDQLQACLVNIIIRVDAPRARLLRKHSTSSSSGMVAPQSRLRVSEWNLRKITSTSKVINLNLATQSSCSSREQAPSRPGVRFMLNFAPMPASFSRYAKTNSAALSNSSSLRS